MPEIKAHYYIENITLHKKHPRDGGVVVHKGMRDYDASQVVECIGHVKVDIISIFVMDGELAFTKIRTTNNLMGDEVEGWTLVG